MKIELETPGWKQRDGQSVRPRLSSTSGGTQYLPHEQSLVQSTHRRADSPSMDRTIPRVTSTSCSVQTSRSTTEAVEYAQLHVRDHSAEPNIISHGRPTFLYNPPMQSHFDPQSTQAAQNLLAYIQETHQRSSGDAALVDIDNELMDRTTAENPKFSLLNE